MTASLPFRDRLTHHRGDLSLGDAEGVKESSFCGGEGRVGFESGARASFRQQRVDSCGLESKPWSLAVVVKICDLGNPEGSAIAQEYREPSQPHKLY